MLKLFAELSHEERISAGLDQLQSCSVAFQEIMNSIHEDPFVFSLLEGRRGQKGFRDLQGDSLQQGLETILEILVRSKNIHVHVCTVHVHVHVLLYTCTCVAKYFTQYNFVIGICGCSSITEAYNTLCIIRSPR